MVSRRMQLLWATLTVVFNINEAGRLRSAVSNTSNQCSPPDEVHERLVKQGMALFSAGETFILYGTDETAGSPADEEEEKVTVVLFDCLKGKELVFLHIPKNAGSSIENIADKQGVEWGRYYKGKGQIMPDGNRCPAWHVPPALKKPPNPYDNPNAEVFCVVRDPWERMRSEYIYVLSHKYFYRGILNSTHAWAAPQCTLKGFNKFVIGNLEDFLHGIKYQCYCHIVPQWDFVEGPHGRQWCKHVLPIGDLTPRFNALMSSHGLPVRMHPWTNSNVGKHCPLLKRYPLDQLYWPYTQKLMRRVYWKDFRHLGDSLYNASAADNGSSIVQSNQSAEAKV